MLEFQNEMSFLGIWCLLFYCTMDLKAGDVGFTGGEMRGGGGGGGFKAESLFLSCC